METKQGHLTKFRQIPSARISRPEAGGGGSLHLYCTGGDGKFIPPVDVPVSSLVRQITTADVDGNGSSDVVTSLPCERTLLVALSRKHWPGSMRPRVRSSLSPLDTRVVNRNTRP